MEVVLIVEVIHLSKNDVIEIIAKYFNTYSSEVYIDCDDGVLRYGTCYTDNCGIKPLAIVRKQTGDNFVECHEQVNKYKSEIERKENN